MKQQPTETWKHFFGKDYLKFGPYLRENEETKAAIDGVIHELDLPKGSRILDLCCGYGRLSIPLAEAGYKVVGLDGAVDLIEHARTETKSRKDIDISFIHGDARSIDFFEEFDAVINMGGAFGYTLNPTEDQTILRNIFYSLKPSGKVIMEMPTRDGHVRLLDNSNQEISFGNTHFKFEYRYNPISGHWGYNFEWSEDQVTKYSSLDFLLYTPSEIIDMLTKVGVSDIQIYGDWDRTELQVDQVGMLVFWTKEGINYER